MPPHVQPAAYCLLPGVPPTILVLKDDCSCNLLPVPVEAGALLGSARKKLSSKTALLAGWCSSNSQAMQAVVGSANWLKSLFLLSKHYKEYCDCLLFPFSPNDSFLFCCCLFAPAKDRCYVCLASPLLLFLSLPFQIPQLLQICRP